jgi:dTDP-4-dehydrorhamnose 3,5-epimerase
MINGVEYFSAMYSHDDRGSFSKKFSSLNANFREFELSEVFITHSLKGVVRGMHLQVDSAANWRLITALTGGFFDVLIDLRKGSSTYLQHVTQVLEPGCLESVLVPPGVAHGFQSLEDSKMLYLTTSPFEPLLDSGVNIDSLNVKFPLEVTYRSQRDLELPNLKDF